MNTAPKCPVCSGPSRPIGKRHRQTINECISCALEWGEAGAPESGGIPQSQIEFPEAVCEPSKCETPSGYHSAGRLLISSSSRLAAGRRSDERLLHQGVHHYDSPRVYSKSGSKSIS
jgi:hypothetical protein